MATDFSPLSGREPSRPPPEPRRFVPTLTDVVHLPDALAPQPEAPAPATPVPLAIDTDATVTRVCATVAQGLDEHLRAVVADAMQAQHMLLVQALRSQLTPLIEALVRDAVAGEIVHATRQAGDSCIQATD